MPIVHRDARTDHLSANSLPPNELGLLGEIFEHALQSQEFARVLAEQIGAIAARRQSFRTAVTEHLKAKSKGTRARHPDQILDVLCDLLEAQAGGLTKENARQLVAIKHSKSASTIEDIEKQGREEYPGLQECLVLRFRPK